jgi:hypothetical protein
VHGAAFVPTTAKNGYRSGKMIQNLETFCAYRRQVQRNLARLWQPGADRHPGVTARLCCAPQSQWQHAPWWLAEFENYGHRAVLYMEIRIFVIRYALAFAGKPAPQVHHNLPTLW